MTNEVCDPLTNANTRAITHTYTRAHTCRENIDNEDNQDEK